MPIGMESGRQGTRNAELISVSKRKLYAKTLDQCRDDILEAIRNGDHEQAWEIICDGPERGGWRNPITVHGEKGGIRVFLGETELMPIRECLLSIARNNGWDEDTGRARVVGMFAAQRAAINQAVRKWRARA